jgi:AcrR family transcriptional regulator
MRKKNFGTSIRNEIFNLKRERIIDAAVELFYHRGYEKTTLDSIADKLGVRKPFIYSYFESKGDLLTKICEHGVAEGLAAAIAVLDSDEGPAVQLRRICHEMVLTVIRNQKHNAICSREEKNLLPKQSEKISKIRREFDRRLNDVLVAGCESGDFSIEDTKLATLAIDGIGTWVQVWYKESGRLDPESIARKLTTLILTMVKA